VVWIFLNSLICITNLGCVLIKEYPDRVYPSITLILRKLRIFFAFLKPTVNLSEDTEAEQEQPSFMFIPIHVLLKEDFMQLVLIMALRVLPRSLMPSLSESPQLKAGRKM
jgi:hypothetical protein